MKIATPGGISSQLKDQLTRKVDYGSGTAKSRLDNNLKDKSSCVQEKYLIRQVLKVKSIESKTKSLRPRRSNAKDLFVLLHN